MFIQKINRNLLLFIVVLLSTGCQYYPEQAAIAEAIRVFETPQQLDGDQAWVAIKEGRLPETVPQFNQGLSSDYFWVTLKLSDYPLRAEARYLEILNPHIDTAICYLIRNDEVVLLGMAGDHIPFKEREFKVPNLLFELPPLEHSDQLLLKLDKQNGNMSFPLNFLNKSELEVQELKKAVGYSMFFGIMALTFLIAFFYGVFNQIRSLIFYSIFVLLTLGFHLNNTGYAYAFIFPEMPELTTLARMFFMFFAMLVLLIFEYFFLELYKEKTIGRIHKIVTYALGGFIISGFLFYGFYYDHAATFVRIYFALNYVVNFWAIIAAFLVRKKIGFRSYAFLAAHIGNYIGNTLGVIEDTKILPITSYWLDPWISGTVFELFVFNLSLIFVARHFNRINRELENSLHGLNREAMEFSKQNKLLETQIQLTGNNSSDFTGTDNDYGQIAYIQVEEHYLYLYPYPVSADTKVSLREPMKSFLERLPEKQFFRTHRSYVINKNFLKKMAGNYVMLTDGTEIPLSRSYKNKLLAMEQAGEIPKTKE